MKTLYIMCGVPGSGKSTWIKSHIKPNEICVSRDQIRFSVLKDEDDYFSKEKEVEKAYYETIIQSLSNKDITSVYADATQSNSKSRWRLLSTLFLLGLSLDEVNIVPIIFRTSLSKCIKRNSLRKGKERVPDQVIKNMWNKFSLPQLDEFCYAYEKYIEIKEE